MRKSLKKIYKQKLKSLKRINYLNKYKQLCDLLLLLKFYINYVITNKKYKKIIFSKIKQILKQLTHLFILNSITYSKGKTF
jgi:hypothetical protein